MSIQLAEPPRTALQAGIRRATFAAHREVAQLDKEGLASLERVYKQAAAEISARIAASAGADGNLALQEMQSALAQVNGVLEQLSLSKNTILQGGLVQAANLGVKPLIGSLDAPAVLSTEASIAIADEALQFVRSFIAEDGLQLADRVWRIDKHARELVTGRIEQAVIQGHSASRAAAEFLGKGLQVPQELRDKIGAAAADELAKQTGAALLKGPGAPLDNAMRLFRTEINRAHGESYMKGAARTEGFAGWKYLLSPAHPKPDICDLLSTQNLYGLGPGVYPTREKTPWPAHPNTLSFIVIVFDDEISEKDKAGKETSLEALKRLSPERQQGVLGTGKMELLQRGKLAGGMIRTPLKSVLKRVTAIDAKDEVAKVAAAAAAAKKAAALAKAAEEAKQAAALEKINAIAAAGKGHEYQALKNLKKAGELKNLQPAEQIEKIAAGARTVKAKKAISDALSKYKKNVLAGKEPPPAAAAALQKLPQSDQDAFLAKLELAKQEAAKKAAAAGEFRLADFDLVGPQRGSNPGGLYRNKGTGEEWYIKTPASVDAARNEILAGKLYQALGIEVPELRLVDMGKKAGVASRIVPELRQDAAALRAGKIPGVADGFAIDAWLANWDVAGANFDNLLIREGRAFRVDTGGALRYRAQGSLKGEQWGPTVTELQSMRNASNNAQTAAAFKHVTKAQLEASAARLQILDDGEIRRLVKEYGPLDAKENAALADTLIARKQDILKKVKPDDTPIPAPVDAASRVSSAEHKLIRDSRLNGYMIPTDKGDIEDHSVLVWHEKAADGRPRTVAQFKVTGEASQRLNKVLQASGANVKFDDAGLHDKLIEAIKGVATLAAKGEKLRDKDLERVTAARAALTKINKGMLVEKSPYAQKFFDHYAPWVLALERAVQGNVGKAAAWKSPGKDLLKRYTPPPPPPKPGAIAFQRREGEFERKRIERGFATETKERNYSTGYYFETEIDGARVRYWPNAEDVPFALRNQVQIQIAGDAADDAGRIFKSIGTLGVSSARAAALDREELYLRQIAYHRRDEFAAFQAIAEAKASQQERVDAMKAWLTDKTGADLANTKAYRPDGIYQAFGQGRRQLFRPDLQGKEWERFQKDYVLHHRITQGGMVSAIETILNSGGQMAPTVDKLRRGLPLGGMSPDADLGTGGASYLFTRLRGRKTAGNETGLVWKSRLVARLDAISYDGDRFGRTTGDFVLQNRKVGIEEWRAAVRSRSNETILKNGLSIFDDLEHIIVDSGDYNRLLEVFRKHGYTTWPDGRSLEDVIKIRGSV